MEDKGSLINNRYQIIETLGSGGMGTVFRVTDTKLNKKIALKTIKKEFVTDKKTIQRFAIEGKIGQDISHENIVKVYDYDYKEHFYIAMELLEGGSLEDKIEAIKKRHYLNDKKSEDRQKDYNNIISYLKDIARGLAALHFKSIIHRDLKPANILFDNHQTLKITDFGIAREIDSKDKLTEVGERVGTALYRSPEQLRGDEVTLSSDIYTFGLIAYELLTGELPFENEHGKHIFIETEQKLNFKKSFFKVPSWLRDIIERCCEIDPEKRFRSIQEVQIEIANEGEGDRFRNYYNRFKFLWVDRLSSTTKSLVTSVAAAFITSFLVCDIPGFQYSGVSSEYLEPIIMDYWFDIRKSIPPPETVAIASYDEPTKQKYNLDIEAKWPRGLLARTIENLKLFDPDKIVLDLRLLDTKDPDSDGLLRKAIKDNNVYLASFDNYKLGYGTDDKIRLMSELTTSNSYFRDEAKGLFAANLNKTRNLVRSFYFDKLSKVEKPPIANLAKSADEYPTANDYINYYGSTGTIIRESVYKIVEEPQSIPKITFQNKVVFLGTHYLLQNDKEGRDTFNIPGKRRMSGVEIHATSLGNIIDKTWIRSLLEVDLFIFTFLTTAVLGLFILNLRGVLSVLFYLVGTGVLLRTSYYLFTKNILLPVLTVQLIFSIIALFKLGAMLEKQYQYSKRKKRN